MRENTLLDLFNLIDAKDLDRTFAKINETKTNENSDDEFLSILDLLHNRALIFSDEEKQIVKGLKNSYNTYKKYNNDKASFTIPKIIALLNIVSGIKKHWNDTDLPYEKIPNLLINAFKSLNTAKNEFNYYLQTQVLYADILFNFQVADIPRALANYDNISQHLPIILNYEIGAIICESFLDFYYENKDKIYIQILRKYLKIVEEHNNDLLNAKFYFKLASSIDYKQWENKLDYYTKAKFLSCSVDKKFYTKALDEIGNLYIQQKQYEDAIVVYTESMECWKDLGEIYNYYTALSNLGSIYLETNETSKAKDIFESIIKDKVDFTYILSSAHGALSKINDTANKPIQKLNNTCEKYLLDLQPAPVWTCSLMKSSGNEWLRSDLTKIIDEALHLKLEYILLEFLTTVLEISEQYQNFQIYAFTLEQLGNLSVSMQDLEGAQKYLKKGLEINAKIGHERGQIKILYLLGKTYFQQDKSKQANKTWQQAYELFEQWVVSNSQGFELLYNLETLLEGINLGQDLYQYLKVAKQINHKYLIGWYSFLIGQTFAKTKDYGKAFQYFAKTMEAWSLNQPNILSLRAEAYIALLQNKIQIEVPNRNTFGDIVEKIANYVEKNTSVYWVYSSAVNRKYWSSMLSSIDTITTELGINENSQSNYFSIGIGKMKEGDLPAAEEFLLKALQAKSQKRDKINNKLLNFVLGWLYKVTSNLKKAEHYLNEVKDELLQEKETNARADKSLGYVFQLTGELYILNQNEEKAIENWSNINYKSILKSSDILI